MTTTPDYQQATGFFPTAHSRFLDTGRWSWQSPPSPTPPTVEGGQVGTSGNDGVTESIVHPSNLGWSNTEISFAINHWHCRSLTPTIDHCEPAKYEPHLSYLHPPLIQVVRFPRFLRLHIDSLRVFHCQVNEGPFPVVVDFSPRSSGVNYQSFLTDPSYLHRKLQKTEWEPWYATVNFFYTLVLVTASFIGYRINTGRYSLYSPAG